MCWMCVSVVRFFRIGRGYENERGDSHSPFVYSLSVRVEERERERDGGFSCFDRTLLPLLIAMAVIVCQLHKPNNHHFAHIVNGM